MSLEDCINYTTQNYPERPLSYKYITTNPQTGKMGYVSKHSLEEQLEVFQSVRIISLMTIKLSSVSSKVTTPQLSILTAVCRNKRCPEEDSHLVRLSSKKRKKQLSKDGTNVFGVSGLEVKSVTVNFNITTHRSAIDIIGRICFSFHVLQHRLGL